MPVPKTVSHRQARTSKPKVSGLQRAGENPSLLALRGIGVQPPGAGGVPEVQGDWDRTTPVRCELCRDDGHIVTVDARGDRMARECACRQVKRGEALVLKAGIPPKFVAATLDTYRPENHSQERAIIMARGYVRRWPLETHPGLAFSGPVGVGKTGLAIAIMRGVALKRATCRFENVEQLIKAIKATIRGDGSEHELLAPILTAELAVLDEVDAARTSPFNLEIVKQIIGTRYDQGLATIITTNRAMQGPGAAPARGGPSYDSGLMRSETLGDCIGAPMFDRLREMCETVEMVGESRRGRR